MPEALESLPANLSIDGEQLRSMLEDALALFGDAGGQYKMDDLAAHGIRFEKNATFDLTQVQGALLVLGEDGSALIIERVKREIARA